MKIGDLNTGDWFEYQGGRFIKTEPVERGVVIYRAVSLVSGLLALPAPNCDGPDHLSEVEVMLVAKPVWAFARR